MQTTDNTERFKNVEHSRTFRNICDKYDLRDKAVLDIGSGFGQYLKHFGNGSVGITTAEEEVRFGKDHNLNIKTGNAEKLDPLIGHFNAIWANNLYEHLLSPHAFLMNLKKVSEKDTIAILGVPVVPKIASLMNLRWWRGALASNHINFFTHITLRLTVERAGWRVLDTRPFLFKNKFLDFLARPFAPHMYVVSKNNVEFKYPPKKVGEWIGDAYYGDLLSITNQEK
ncbi:class I SAM-dependent methyltransferase [Candidatus Parcubacteria bacterium]|nr:class I SAM-dependent methyltransferase [Candidatus Parcubacteria bacterium]